MIILVSDHHVEVVLHQGYSELTGNFLQLSPLLCSCLGAIRVVHSSSAQCYRAELCPRQPLLHLEHVEDNPDGRMHVEAKLAHQIPRLALVVTSVFSIENLVILVPKDQGKPGLPSWSLWVSNIFLPRPIRLKVDHELLQ